MIISFAFQFLSAVALAENKVIDLGEMSVNGELRRPTINWIDSQKPVRERVPDFFKAELEDFEKSLVAPLHSSTLPPRTDRFSLFEKFESSLLQPALLAPNARQENHARH